MLYKRGTINELRRLREVMIRKWKELYPGVERPRGCADCAHTECHDKCGGIDSVRAMPIKQD
jgi:hypothetical protein